MIASAKIASHKLKLKKWKILKMLLYMNLELLEKVEMRSIRGQLIC